MATRRTALRHLALGLGVLACGRALGQPAEGATYVGIETGQNGISQARFIAASGRSRARLPLSFRAHGLAQNGQTLVVFPRRPGNRFARVDCTNLELRDVVTAPDGRHFFGHGAFSADGQTLLVPENDLETLQGALGVYSMGAQARRLGMVPLPGPGPHEIVRAPLSDQFYIALGGLETHPDYGRVPLNLHDFRSQVLRYDLAKGVLEPLGFWGGSEGVSLRHLAHDRQGRLYVGGQVPGARAGPVLWLVEGGQPRALDASTALGGYVSSVAADGGRALVSSKATGRVLTLEGADIVADVAWEGASAVALKGRAQAQAGFTLLRLGEDAWPAPHGYEFDNHGLMY